MLYDPRKDKIVVLILKWLRGELSAGEAEELEQWKNESPENRVFFETQITADIIAGDLGIAMSMDESSIDSRLNRAIGAIGVPGAQHPETEQMGDRVERRRRIKWTRRIEIPRIRPFYRPAAAVAIGLIVITALVLNHRSPGGGSPGVVHTMLVSGDVAPGGDRAVLTLADGRQIILDSVEIGELSAEGNTEVRKIKKNRLSYEEDPRGGADSTGVHPGKKNGGRPQLYNTLTTPRAGEFQVRLPDGTNVWLNNASTLRYPTSFSGARRQVELSGEAYFEVAPDVSKPFVVRVMPHAASAYGGLEVEVLGTSFNIMAYPDETSIKTSLLNGAVKVSAGAASVMLKPNQQARLETKGREENNGPADTRGSDAAEAETPGTLKVGPVDAKLVVAWKDGFFNFSNSDVPAVMRQLARWYDVTVEYAGKIPVNSYDGRIGRDLSLSDVEKVLAESHVFFKISGKKIIISP